MDQIKTSPFIEGDTLALRDFDESYLTQFKEWMNDKDYRKYSRQEVPIMMASQHQWYSSIQGSNQSINFSVWYKPENKLIAFAGIFNINWIDRNAEIGYGIGDKNYWGKGLGSEMVSLIVKYAFEELNLHRIYATIIDGNVSSRRCLEKTGFTLEGTRKDDTFLDGKYVDKFYYALLAPEYFKN